MPFALPAAPVTGDGVVFRAGEWKSTSKLGADTLGAPFGAVGTYYDGTYTDPTLLAHPSFAVARNEKITAAATPNILDPKYNAAIWANSVSLPGNKVQPTGVFGMAWGEVDTGQFAVGVEAIGQHETGGGGAMGIFIVSQTDLAANTAMAYGLEMAVINNSGFDSTVVTNNLALNRFIGIDIDYQSTPAKKGSMGIAIRADSGGWDTGITFMETNIYTAAILDASNSPAVLQVTKTHTYAVDVSGATLTTAWHGALSVDNEIKSTRATGSAYMYRVVGTGTGARNWGITVLTNGALDIDDATGGVQVLQLAPGTPAANLTGLAISTNGGLKTVQSYVDGSGRNVLFY